MQSMTGFGAASRSPRGISVTAEAKSVNNKYLKVSLRTPPSLNSREGEILGLVRERVERGSVQLFVRLEREATPVSVRYHADVAGQYRRHLGRMEKDHGLDGPPDTALLAGLPGVFSLTEEEGEVAAETFDLVAGVIGQALDRMVRMRKREGAALRRDLSGRRTVVAGLVRRIRDRAPAVAREQLARMRERVARLLEGAAHAPAEQDLHRELALLAERSDVTEELTRLTSHLDQFGRALRSDGGVGRRLDFLVQEMAREANTISAKSGDVELSKLCVDLKVELDRMREQVQNVE